MDSEAQEDSEAREDLLATLVLMRLPGFGPGCYWRLQHRLGRAESAWSAPQARLRECLPPETLETLLACRNDSHHILWQLAREDLDYCAVESVTLLRADNPAYPRLLTETHNPPPLLFVRGKAANLALPQLAVVGSRKPTHAGRDTAFQFSRALAGAGFAVTSGLALGVDGAAHSGALAGNGATVAVMGTGIDQIYPRRHRALARDIIQSGGTLVSGFPRGAEARAQHFPRRNRIISGMSLGVLVVEAAIRSGSLITARYAMQQGREVFAMPGSIHNPLSRGCHALLREGATLVEQVEDLRESLQGMLAFKWEEAREAPTPAEAPVALDPAAREILEAVGFGPTPLDVLCQRTRLDTGELLARLMDLELQGLVEESGDCYQRRAR